MMSRRSLLFAVRALAVGFAALAVAPSADAGLVYTIERYTDNTFSTLIGGYTVTSSTGLATDTVGLNYIAGTITTTGGGPATVIGAADFGFNSTDRAAITLKGNGDSTQTDLVSMMVNNQTDIDSSVAGPLFFKVSTSQDAFTKPSTNPLAFDISLTEQNVDDSASTFGATLTTDGGANFGTLGPISPGSSGPISVANNSLGGFTVMGLTFITLDVSGNSGFNRITSTGQANVTATPEPATLVSALVGLGLVAGVSRLRRRRTTTA
jgi:hypothetical protein